MTTLKEEIDEYITKYNEADEDEKRTLLSIAANESFKWDSIFMLITHYRQEK